MDTSTHDTAGAAPELQIEGAIATITLRRPRQANRLEPNDLGVLAAHFRQLASMHAEVRALILTGTGRHFSAGFDLGAFDPAAQAVSSQEFSDMVDALEALPQTTVCAINGGVFGGATDLALACDFRVGTPEARMFMPAARFSLHYYASGLRRYVTRLGLNEAKRLFLLADEIDAQRMLAIGYLTDLCPVDDLMTRAHAMARRACELAPLATAGMKRALNTMAAQSYDAQAGEQLYRACMASDDLREGVAALREKRAPRFTAR